MNKKVPLGLALALLLVVASLAVTLTMVFAMDRFSTTVNEVAKRQAMFDYITEIDKAVRQNHAGTIDESELREALASAYMESIGDKYAGYFTAQDYTDLQREQAGMAEGYGITLQRGPLGEIVIARVDAGSPAGLAGVQVGDVLTAIGSLSLETVDGYLLANEELEAASAVVLTVLRGEKSMSFSMVRNEYTLVSVTGRMIGTYGYIRIHAFNAVTPQQFFEQYEALLSQGATGVIFDLRDCRGGTLSSVTSVLGYLMPRGDYAVMTDSSGKTSNFSASESAYVLSLPTVTLVSAATEGEAELFAGVLQDFALTNVVGVTTKGRACVQDYFTLSSDSAAIRLTVGELSLRHGGSWEGKGLTPNREVRLPLDAPSLDRITDEEDTQLQAALSVLIGPTTTEPTTTTTVEGETTTTVEGETTTTTAAEE